MPEGPPVEPGRSWGRSWRSRSPGGWAGTVFSVGGPCAGAEGIVASGGAVVSGGEPAGASLPSSIPGQLASGSAPFRITGGRLPAGPSAPDWPVTVKVSPHRLQHTVLPVSEPSTLKRDQQEGQLTATLAIRGSPYGVHHEGPDAPNRITPATVVQVHGHSPRIAGASSSRPSHCTCKDFPCAAFRSAREGRTLAHFMSLRRHERRGQWCTAAPRMRFAPGLGEDWG